MEFEKMFMGRYLHYGLYYLFALGIFEKLFDIEKSLVEKSLSENTQRKTFIVLGRKLQKAQQNFVEKLRPYYYLFICRPYLQTDIVEILERLGAPRRYYKKITAAPIPENVTVSFIANLSLKEGIIEYVGNYDAKVIAMAKKLDVWDKPFDRGVTAAELLAEGFAGQDLGHELNRRTQEKIMTLKEK
jgi:tRNA nucleotidyltransferase (CCA-adding enzyme)